MPSAPTHAPADEVGTLSATSSGDDGAPARRSTGPVSRWLLRPLWWAAPVLAITPLAAAGWFVNRFNPTDRLADPTGPCLFHAVTGINGPSCGGTRMFYYLIHGDLVNAARHHLPALLAVPFLGYLWLRWALGRVGVNLPALRVSRWWLIGYAVFFLLFTTVLRNINWGPFAWFDIPNLDMPESR